jgi:hypothetical protein
VATFGGGKSFTNDLRKNAPPVAEVGLVEIVAHFAVLLELADESEIPLRVAVREQEELAFRLQQLSKDERTEFLLLQEIAKAETSLERRAILDKIPEDTGLV